MKQTFKVVMLPTNTESEIHLQNLWLYAQSKFQSFDSVKQFFKPQHLYIISDDEIKKGDWYYNPSDNQFGSPHIERCEYDHEAKACLNEPVCKKIIATTDNSVYDAFPRKVYDGVAIIPISFVHAYIKAYNDGKTIKEVGLEMDVVFLPENAFPSEQSHVPILKLRADGSVIVKQNKTYTREDVVNIIYSFAKDWNTKEVRTSEWIEENL